MKYKYRICLILILDESSFQLCPTPGPLLVRKRLGEAYNPQCLAHAPTMKFGGGLVTIWGFFSKTRIEQIRL